MVANMFDDDDDKAASGQPNRHSENKEAKQVKHFTSGGHCVVLASVRLRPVSVSTETREPLCDGVTSTMPSRCQYHKRVMSPW